MAIVLDNGITVNTSLRAVHKTDNAFVQRIFGYPRGYDCTVHHWGALGQNIHTVAQYLASANERSVSAHVVLQEDYVYFLVDFDDAAWHAGNAEGNAKTIGIECRPEMTEGDLKTLASVIRYIQKHTPDSDALVYIHQNWTPTACPGKYATQVDKIVNLVNAGNITPSSTPTKPPVPVKPAPPKPPAKPVAPSGKNTGQWWIVEKGDTLGKIAEYYYGDVRAVQKIAAHNRISPDAKLQIGWKLYIPGPLYWIVEPNDTLGKIAKYYGVTVEYLVKYNGIKNPNEINVGQQLWIIK